MGSISIVDICILPCKIKVFESYPQSMHELSSALSTANSPSDIYEVMSNNMAQPQEHLLTPDMQAKLALYYIMWYNLFMAYTKVPIITETRSVEAHTFSTVMLVLLGFLTGTFFTVSVTTPIQTSTTHIASVAADTLDSPPPLPLALNVPGETSTPPSTLATDWVPDIEEESPEILDSEDLTQNEDVVAIERSYITNEIALMRNDLLRIMSEFDSTCGTWTDPCAQPYAERLAVHNSVYHDLVKTLEELPQ